MAQVVLFLALLLASGIGTGEGVLSVGESLLDQSLSCLDQNDGRDNAKPDILDASTAWHSTFSLLKNDSFSFPHLPILVLAEDHTKSLFIRAPPVVLI